MRFYRGYKNLNIETYKTKLSTVLSVSKIEDYSSFPDTFTSALLKHAPIKKKMQDTIILRKMKSSHNKIHTQENLNCNKKQRKFCVNLLRKTKNDYISNLNIKDLPYYRKFWKTIKPYFCNKGLQTSFYLSKGIN